MPLSRSPQLPKAAQNVANPQPRGPNRRRHNPRSNPRLANNHHIQHSPNTPAIQYKLRVSQPHDPLEQEADHIADQVMRMADTELPTLTATPQIQRSCCGSCAGGGSCEDEPVARHADNTHQDHAGGSHVDRATVMNGLGSGAPLPASERSFFEPRMGADLSHVRVHTGGAAAKAAESVQAKAFTLGRDVVFGAGQFSPGTTAGRRLMAHELAHVAQQGIGLGRSALLSQYTTTRQHAGVFRQNMSLPPGCEELLVQILARMAELARRAAELVENRLNLPQSGPMSIEGHQQQFRNKQTNLRRMLDQWNTNNCGPPPPNAWNWATRPTPAPRAPPNTQPRVQTPTPLAPPTITAEEVATIGGLALAGYITYRVVRMLPSLLPPLWPTIPVNAAVP